MSNSMGEGKSKAPGMRALRPLAVIVDPLGAVPRAVEARGWVVPLLLAMSLSAGASAAIATRLDTSRIVIPRLEAAGELSKVSEREISEQVEQAQRLAIVGGVAKGVFLVPLVALLGAAGLWFCSWLVGGRGTFAELFTVVCLALLPMAVAQGITLASALRQQSLTPKLAMSLVPSSLSAVIDEPAPIERPGWKATATKSLIGLVDFFHVWSALLLGLGFAAATKRSRWFATPFGALLYFLVIAAVTIGLPGLGDGGGGGPR